MTNASASWDTRTGLLTKAAIPAPMAGLSFRSRKSAGTTQPPYTPGVPARSPNASTAPANDVLTTVPDASAV